MPVKLYYSKRGSSTGVSKQLSEIFNTTFLKSIVTRKKALLHTVNVPIPAHQIFRKPRRMGMRGG